MPVGIRSELTELVDAISDQMIEQHDALVEAWGVIPFMQEQISRKEYQRRWYAMTPSQRLGEVQRIGIGEVLKLVNPGAGG